MRIPCTWSPLSAHTIFFFLLYLWLIQPHIGKDHKRNILIFLSNDLELLLAPHLPRYAQKVDISKYFSTIHKVNQCQQHFSSKQISPTAVKSLEKTKKHVLGLLAQFWWGQTNGLDQYYIVVRVLSLNQNKAVLSEQSRRVLLRIREDGVKI